MINFYLPNFTYYAQPHGSINLRTIELLEEHPELFYDDIRVGAVYGVFGASHWNGGRADISAQADDGVIHEIMDNFNKHGVPLRFTFTNPLITEEHLSDTYCNRVMRLCENGLNEVLVNSPILEEYLRRTYPGYKFVSSTSKCERDINKINDALDQYHMLVIDYRDNHDWDFLDKIKDKSKIEILCDSFCKFDCTQNAAHYRQVAEMNLKLRGDLGMDMEVLRNGANPQFDECGKHKTFYDTLENNPATMKIEEIYGKYKDEGFVNFKLDGRTYSPTFVAVTICYYMVKPEHYLRFLEMVM